jgi:hypothetical protein
MYNMHISFGSTRVRLEYCILAALLFWLFAGSVLCTCCVITPSDLGNRILSIFSGREGFSSGSPGTHTSGFASVDSVGTATSMSGDGSNFFGDNTFSPECCKGSTYSSSTGCACLTKPQYEFILERGGNNVPVSGF